MNGDCGHLRTDLGGYVLGGLTAEETRAVEAHLRTCEDCRAELRELRDLPGLMALAREPSSEAPDLLRARVLAALPPRRPRRRTLWAVAAALGLGAVAGALGAPGWLSDRGPESPSPESVPASAVVEVIPGEGFSASGRMTVQTVEGRTHVSLDLQGLEDLPQGAVYEAWLSRPDRDEPVSIGQFAADHAGSASVRLWADGPTSEYDSMWVTAEPDADDPSHDGPTVARARLP